MTREEFIVNLYLAGAKAGLKSRLTLMLKNDFDRLITENDNPTCQLVEVFSSYVLVKFMENETISE